MAAVHEDEVIPLRPGQVWLASEHPRGSPHAVAPKDRVGVIHKLQHVEAPPGLAALTAEVHQRARRPGGAGDDDLTRR